MGSEEIKGLDNWVTFLSQVEIPVLKQTARELNALHEDADRISARGVADVIARDPLMTVKLLRYLQVHKHSQQDHEVVQVEQALLMLGVETLFKKFPPKPLAEEMLRGHTSALISLLSVVHRSHRASDYARDWAARMHDLHFEEVRIAALLHDIAELLMWCFAPGEMLKISALLQQDKTRRSHSAQEEILGFSLVDLNLALASKWSLPKLLQTLMDDKFSMLPRVRNITLAVNLSRHSAKGWDDAALPGDYQEIGELLNMKADDVKVMIGEE